MRLLAVSCLPLDRLRNLRKPVIELARDTPTVVQEIASDEALRLLSVVESTGADGVYEVVEEFSA